MRGVKLGVLDEPVRHTAADTPDRLERRAFKCGERVLEAVLRRRWRGCGRRRRQNVAIPRRAGSGATFLPSSEHFVARAPAAPGDRDEMPPP
jgi:hypothetical protein